MLSIRVYFHSNTPSYFSFKHITFELWGGAAKRSVPHERFVMSEAYCHGSALVLNWQFVQNLRNSTSVFRYIKFCVLHLLHALSSASFSSAWNLHAEQYHWVFGLDSSFKDHTNDFSLQFGQYCSDIFTHNVLAKGRGVFCRVPLERLVRDLLFMW